MHGSATETAPGDTARNREPHFLSVDTTDRLFRRTCQTPVLLREVAWHSTTRLRVPLDDCAAPIQRLRRAVPAAPRPVSRAVLPFGVCSPVGRRCLSGSRRSAAAQPVTGRNRNTPYPAESPQEIAE